MLKVNNRDTRARCEISSKLKIKIPERRQLWIYFTPCSSVSIFNFEQVNSGWDRSPIFYVHIRDLLTKGILLLRIYFFSWGANWSSALIQNWRNLSEPLMLVLMYSIDKFIKRFFAEIIIGKFATISVKYNFRSQFWKIGFHDPKYHLMKVWEASL